MTRREKQLNRMKRIRLRQTELAKILEYNTSKISLYFNKNAYPEIEHEIEEVILTKEGEMK